MIKLSDYGLFEDTARPEEKRRYQAARHTKQNRDWVSQPYGANWILRCDLSTLRARARDMAKNSPHFRKFLQMAKANVIGHKGIQLQCDAVFETTKRPHTAVNSRIENAFWAWGRRETCTESGKLNWVQAQQLCVETLIRDGEVLVEHLDASNPFAYAIRFWNVDWLDETHNELLPDGNRIIMGVEVDRRDRPVAYWLTEPPSENGFGYGYGFGYRGNPPQYLKGTYRFRIGADKMTHIFLVTEDECQIRGVTWFHAALLQGKDMHEYTTGVVQSARVTSHVFGFIEDELADENEYMGIETDEGVEKVIDTDVRPLSINSLLPGQKFTQFDPKQPAQNHSEFLNSMLHVLAAGFGITGFSLAGDMSQVNFSSARVGLGEEREVWRSLQEFVADTFCREVFRRWLLSSWLGGRIDITTRDYEQLQNAIWRPRGWSYIEPSKDIKAAIDAIQHNLLTYKEHFAERGIDLEEWLAEKQAEKALFEQYDVEYMPAPKAKASSASGNPGDGDEESAPNTTKTGKNYANGEYRGDLAN